MPRAASLDALVDDAYAELRRIAARYVRAERAPTVQATELVHEAYLRLARDQPEALDQPHFLAIAAIAMRRLLVERARRRKAAKRGGVQVHVTLDDALLHDEGASPADVLAIDAALTRLGAIDAAHARVVELRYFGGLSVEETAETMAISPATVKRYWALARAWLLRELASSPPPA